MSRVVERCTVCGTEHALTHTGPCEACGGELGFWCMRHQAKTGWLPDRSCPLCAREAAARAAPPPPRPAPPPPRAEPRHAPPADAPRPRRPRVPVDARPPARRPDAPGLGEEVARRLPGVAAGGAGIAWRLLVALFVLARTVVGLGLLGGLVGLAAGYFLIDPGAADGIADPDVLWAGVFGVVGGGLLGLLVGLVRALRVLFAPRE